MADVATQEQGSIEQEVQAIGEALRDGQSQESHADGTATQAATDESQQAADEGQDGQQQADGDDKKPPKGMLAELIEERKERKRLSAELERVSQQVQAVAQQQQVPTRQAQQDAYERQQLQETAEQLRLVTTDAAGNQVWDLEAAKRVNDWGTRVAQKVARQEVQPYQQMTVRERAEANVNTALSGLKAEGHSDQVIKVVHDHFMQVGGQATGAEMLADKKVVDTVLDKAIGNAYRSGLLKGQQPAPPGPPPLMAPATGRRSGGAAIQLSAGAAKVYKEAGIDPTKSAATFDAKGAAILKD